MNNMLMIRNAIRRIMALLILIALCLAPVQTASADTVVYFVAPISQGLGDCSSWANACGLVSALDQALDDDEIWVKAGVYKPTSSTTARSASFNIVNAIGVYGGFNGTETQLAQRDWRLNRTILSGDIDSNDLNSDGNFIAESYLDQSGLNSYHVVKIAFEGTTPRLDGFIITAGNAGEEAGGGVLIQTLAHPILTDLVVIGNQADTGGGVAIIYNANATIFHIHFTGNHAVFGGGGLDLEDASDAVLTNTTFVENSSDYLGGAVYNYSYEGTLTMNNSAWIGNTAVYGAGIYVGYTTTYLKNVTAHGNIASISGGGIYDYDSTTYLENVILWGDQAPSHAEVHINGAASFFDVTYSDIQGCGGSGAWNTACGTNSSGNIDLDPFFINPGFKNLRLELTSPAVDAGDNTALLPAVTIDLDGNPRYVDIPAKIDTGNGTPPLIDMGAFEAHPDAVAPYVISVTRLDPSPSSASSVDYRLAFSEPVLGLDGTDFYLSLTGTLTPGPVYNIRDQGDRTHYDVAVSTGSGFGTQRLNVHQDADVEDLAGNPLIGLPYTYGETYEIRIEKIFLPVIIR